MERVREIVRADLVEPRLADKERREPFGILDEARVREVRPDVALGAPEEAHPVAPLGQRPAPRQAAGPKREGAAGERRGALLVRRDGQRLLGQRQRPEPSAPARPQRSGRAVEGDLVGRLDRPAGCRFDLGEAHRGGDEDARRGGAADHLADREIGFAGERIMRLERRRPPVRHQELAALPPGDGDAVGIGGGEQQGQSPLPLAGDRLGGEGSLPSPPCASDARLSAGFPGEGPKG